MKERLEVSENALALARTIREAGGRALLVGGWVRDRLLELDSKDYDFEVYGLPVARLEEVLGKFGEVIAVGRAFGVLRVKGLDIDFSIPRRDSKTGRGHRGFLVELDPGLDYATASGQNPRLVYLSISGFGTAEGAWLPGYDLIVQAVSGLMSLTGDADGPAFRAGISVFDVMAGLHGLIGVLAALNQRRETGRGQHVEVNLLSSAMSGLVNQTAAYSDFHGTGANPAANSSYVDAAYVAPRFRVVASRRHV